MKYTKTAAALALAGIAAAPLAQAEPAVTLSGSVGINLASDDSDATDGKWNFNGDDSTLNIAATDTLSNGWEGYANYRLDSALSGSGTAGDSIHIGVKGDFGDIRIGEVASALEYGQMAGDILTDIGKTEWDTGESSGAVDAGVSYTNTFGGTTVGLAWSPGGNQDRLEAGVKFSAAGFGIGLGFGQVDNSATTDDTETRMSVGASYAIGGVTVAAALKDFDGFETIGAKLSGTAGDIGWGLTYEANQDTDDDKIRLDASYGLGGGWGVSTRINVTDPKTDYRLQFSKSF